MKVALGNDHEGFSFKADVVNYFDELNIEIIDCGSYDDYPVDFPDIAQEVCRKVKKGEVDRGLMVCGTGVGACIAANKIPGIRASVCHDIHTARQSVEHDDVNVMCLGAQIVGSWLAKDLLKAFFEAEFCTEEHFRRRVKKIRELEKKYAEELLEQNQYTQD